MNHLNTIEFSPKILLFSFKISFLYSSGFSLVNANRSSDHIFIVFFLNLSFFKISYRCLFSKFLLFKSVSSELNRLIQNLDSNNIFVAIACDAIFTTLTIFPALNIRKKNLKQWSEILKPLKRISLFII